MKKLAFFFIVFPCLVFAQSRENRVNITFQEKSEKLTEAPGYLYKGSTGNWVENNNVISSSECSNDPCKSFSEQNFKWMQFATVEHKGKKYYILLFESVSGAYKYPNIKRDWSTEMKTIYFILDDGEYNKIKSTVESQTSENVDIVSERFTGYITDRYNDLGEDKAYNEMNLLAKITTDLEKEPSKYTKSCFKINSQKVDGKDVVRFRLPGLCSRISKIFDTQYFEVSRDAFKKLLSL